MKTYPLIHIEIELDPTPGPISGELVTAVGRERFAGWLELTAAVERARTAPAKEATPS